MTVAFQFARNSTILVQAANAEGGLANTERCRCVLTMDLATRLRLVAGSREEE